MGENTAAKSPTKWVLANPGKYGKNLIQGPTGKMMELTNKKLEEPNTIKTLEHIEKTTGTKLFGTVVVRG